MLSTTQLQGALPAGVSNINANLRLNVNQDGSNTPAVKEQDQVLLEPYEYLCAHPGKDVRTKMIAAFNVWLQVPHDDLLVITKVIGMLHSASLLIDDVEDESALRRGVPAAHHLFGVAQTINSANYVYFLALQEINKLNNPEMVQIYTEELINLHRGQGMEIHWRDRVLCPSEAEFIEMVNNKTGGLLRLAVKLMQAASQSKTYAFLLLTNQYIELSTNIELLRFGHAFSDYTSLVNKIGIHFQVRDDYMNLQSQQYADNKGFCEDLTEGKFSFPIIHSIRTDPHSRQLLNILQKRSNSLDLKQYALQLLEKTDTFNYCRSFLHGIEKEARQEIQELGGNPKLEKIMDALSIPLFDPSSAPSTPSQ
ncbi:geranylgeranyl pyrophosphate synthase [Zychaea mexicana]|uniref:geranylgeranyl pyrophosphate synthase n=1 Tax=Zychaea mexicana TaxID=64656 RepID=UPI0022FDF568|nr:geranylgeranyl pyrophosphate synthase [Zychaea mexicana]KAI9488953.1 geranylgeranyl pyrophosphate synthase [Zychaea mexicana]